MGIERYFLGWERPLVQIVADRLREAHPPGGDWSDCLVWMPSARAGRHLLEELFTGEGRAIEAIHPPRITTPSRFLESLSGEQPGVASHSQILYAWKSVLCRLLASACAPLFPVVPDINRQGWAYHMAAQLISLRKRLAGEDLDMSAIAGKGLTRERERWEQLASLERLYREQLQESSLLDPNDFLRENLENLVAEIEYSEVSVAGVLNLSRLEERCLDRLHRVGKRAEILLPLPVEFAGVMDSTGRPDAAFWCEAAIPESILNNRIQRGHDPRVLTGHILDLAETYRNDIDALAVGSPDPELERYLVERSLLGTARFYSPAGRPLSQTSWGRFMRLLAQWQEDGKFRTLAELLKMQRFRSWLESSGIRAKKLEADLLAVIEERFLRTRHQLNDPFLEETPGTLRIRKSLQFLDQLLATEKMEAAFPDWIWEVLQVVSATAAPNDEDRGVLDTLEDLFLELKESFPDEPVSHQDYWALIREGLETHFYYPEREADERPVSGWLELPWETAGHLVVLGLPDNKVPGTPGAETFLTPGLCREIGIRGPDEEAAFHACRLRILLELRDRWGRLDILLPDRGLDASPSQASRLLFLAKREEILSRVKLLMEERFPEEDTLPRAFGTKLRLPEPIQPDSVSVTDFGAYLRCPFHYFLERHTRWRAPEPLPNEMDALAFGNLSHSVLQQLNESEEGSRLLERDSIAQFLNDVLSDIRKKLLGTGLSVPLIIQEASLRERLRAAAAIMAGERLDGWRPWKVEWKWHKEISFLIGGVPVHGKIDLLEKNEESGAYRIVDYKTSDNAEKPESTHRKKLNSASAAPLIPEMDFQINGKPHRWGDLQLPVYHLAVKDAFGISASCAYFNLSKAVNDIGLLAWNLSTEEIEAARVCAEGIIRAIREGYFPVGNKPRYEDPWLKWFGEDLMANLDPEWIAAHMGDEG